MVAAAVTAQPTYNYQRRFQVKSGHVEYKLSGSLSGTKSLWFDDFGAKYREEIHTHENVKTRKGVEVIESHSLAISDGVYFYNVNLKTMEGTKLHKDAVPDFSILGSGLNDGEMEQLGGQILGAFGGKVEKGSEMVLGHHCDVTQVMGATVCSYKGISLRSVTMVGGIENKEEAISFDENPALSSSHFAPPGDAAIEDVTLDVSGDDQFYEDLEEEQGMMFSTGIEFENFKAESERIRRSLGYVFSIYDASGGQYSAMWTKTAGHMTAILVNSLQNFANWQTDFADDGILFFTNGGHKMAFRSDNFYDEETGESTPGSILLIEVKDRDAFLRITCTPQKSKEELIHIFNQYKF